MKYLYPEEIQIGGHPYRIELHEGYRVGDDDLYVGDADNHKLRIRVATKTAGGDDKAISYIEETLLHEIVHCINEIYQIGVDEKQTDTIAQGLLQVLSQLHIHLVKKLD